LVRPFSCYGCIPGSFQLQMHLGMRVRIPYISSSVRLFSTQVDTPYLKLMFFSSIYFPMASVGRLLLPIQASKSMSQRFGVVAMGGAKSIGIYPVLEC